MSVEEHPSSEAAGKSHSLDPDHPSEHGHHHAFPIRVPMFEEFKRRNLGRVAILYVVVCYLILEPFELFFHLLELPAWAGRGVVLLMVLGFPALLLFAWIYEVTPEGLKPTVQVDPASSIAHHTARRLNRAIIAVLALALAFLVADKFWLSKQISGESHDAAVKPDPAEATVPEKSVAVLPFSDMSEMKNQEYFSDGLTEEIIDALAKIPDLRVPARTSSFYFKGKVEDIPTIARRLKVAHVLEGSVRRNGKSVRISVQLVRAENGYHLWSETYDRKFVDALEIQDEIAAAIAKALKVSLLDGSLTRLQQAEKRRSPEAHAQFRQGIYYEVRDTLEDNRKAIAYFEAAIRLDPNQAVYWAQLSRTLTSLAIQNSAEQTALRDQALHAAEQALRIDPQLPQSHIARAKFAQMLAIDFARATSEVEKAQSLDPTDIDVIAWRSQIAQQSGRLEEALQLSMQVQQLDPMNTDVYNVASGILFDMGRYPDSERSARTAIELTPGTEGAHLLIGLSMLLRGANATTARAEIAQEPDADSRRWGLAMASQLTGHRDEGDKWLAANESSALNPDYYAAAELHAVRGETDQAFAALEHAYDLRSSGLVDIKNDPFLKSMRRDQRFGIFLHKLGFSE